MADLVRRASCAAGLARTSLAAARAHRAGPLATLRRARALNRRGFSPHDQMALGLLDPALSETDLHGHVSVEEMRQARNAVNPVAVAPMSEEKAIFYRLAAAAGVPVPDLYGVVGRETGWSHTGRVVAGPDGFAAFLAEDVPERFVLKPSGGGRGVGVRALTRDGPVLRLAGGGVTDAAALHAEATGGPFGQLAIVQERLANHPALDALCRTETLQCVRVMTLVERDGRVRLLAALFKIAPSGGPIDNFREGSTGNAACEADPATGRLGPALVARRGGPGLALSDHLPDGTRVRGFALPDWARLVAVVTAASALLAPARSIGWDVALTPRGPVVVEANLWYSPWPFPSVRTVADLLAAGG